MSTPSVPEPADKPTGSSRARSFAKYSGIAFQMLGIIGGFTWLGMWLDERYQSKNPWFTVGLMLVGVFLAMFQIIRSLTKGAS
ncbi:AtpZ/AtpI family protein [Hymenobacter sp. BT683]|uniref:AtpZ/AtpI family protein n=1 Tax=Hymenobacter jeongseonensis TaxID=2791027 RepID=A0ABS0ICQ0_9BACT|nr:AtpZ/AtpI family protein [Hymenobacter jeongseonensis]MBF9236095.1 AtpZ/AtpI family protein [Hymenobacter jeongseonensis]